MSLAAEQIMFKRSVASSQKIDTPLPTPTLKMRLRSFGQYPFLFCLLSGLLYGLSWPIASDLNLSFLAWGAFVPLFLFLEKNRDRFWHSLGGSYAALLVFSFITAGWLLNFPQSKGQILFIIFQEAAYFTFPFIPFYGLQRRLGFSRALWLFPLLWVVWEWLYLSLETSMGTHLSAYSQSSNLWLIQFIDLTGMWGIADWLMYFNVFVYYAYRKAGNRIGNLSFFRTLAVPVALLIGLPPAYSVYAYAAYGEIEGEELSVTVIPTHFPAAFYDQAENHRLAIEQTLHHTDSVHYAQRNNGTVADLYVWPETGMNLSLTQAGLGQLLQKVVEDYDGALLSGGRVPVDSTGGDQRFYGAGTLLSARSSIPTHHFKTQLTPGQEIIPYHRWLAQLPGFPITEQDPRYRKAGEQSLPLFLTTWDDREFSLGVSLCFEQWYPNHWAELAQNGAEIYLHLAGENWYGEVGFQQFMANVSRLRCIENRRAGARSSNVGISGFIDAVGRMEKGSASRRPEALSATLVSAGTMSIYTRFPNWFPLFCLASLLAGYFFFTFSKPNKR